MNLLFALWTLPNKCKIPRKLTFVGNHWCILKKRPKKSKHSSLLSAQFAASWRMDHRCHNYQSCETSSSPLLTALSTSPKLGSWVERGTLVSSLMLIFLSIVWFIVSSLLLIFFLCQPEWREEQERQTPRPHKEHTRRLVKIWIVGNMVNNVTMANRTD